MIKNKQKMIEIIESSPHFYQIFHQDTKFAKELSPIRYNENYHLPFKGYPRKNLIKLPKPSNLNQKLTKILFDRSSVKKYAQHQLTNLQLSNILYFSLGLKDLKHPYSSARFTPSPGALNPTEGYMISLNTQLSNGVYHYNPKLHGLELLSSTAIKIEKFFSEKFVKDACIVLLLTTKFDKVITKYEDRGYRYSLLEAGHIGQNIQLISTALHLGCCPLGGFYDDSLNALLHLHESQEAVVYAFSIGSL